MNKPQFPENPTNENILNWEKELFAWEEEQIAHLSTFEGKMSVHMHIAKRLGHTIDRMGYRTFFVATNSRNATRAFNSQSEAVKLARESKFQPVRIDEIRVVPAYTHWFTPLSWIIKNGKYVEKEGKDNG